MSPAKLTEPSSARMKRRCTPPRCEPAQQGQCGRRQVQGGGGCAQSFIGRDARVCLAAERQVAAEHMLRRALLPSQQTATAAKASSLGGWRTRQRPQAAIVPRGILQCQPDAHAGEGVCGDEAAVLMGHHLATHKGLLEDQHRLQAARQQRGGGVCGAGGGGGRRL